MSFWLNHDHHLPISICSVILGNIKATQKLVFFSCEMDCERQSGDNKDCGRGNIWTGFEGRHPVRKRAWTKGGDRKVGLLLLLLLLLIRRFLPLFVFLYSVCARFSCVLGHASKLVFASKWKGVSTGNNVLDFRSGNTTAILISNTHTKRHQHKMSAALTATFCEFATCHPNAFFHLRCCALQCERCCALQCV